MEPEKNGQAETRDKERAKIAQNFALLYFPISAECDFPKGYLDSIFEMLEKPDGREGEGGWMEIVQVQFQNEELITFFVS